MSDSTSNGGKSSSKSSDSKSKPKDTGSSDAAESKPAKSDGDGEKSARESIGGAKDVHYGFFSSVRTPAYRSGWDDIWAKKDARPARKKGANSTSNTKSKTGAKPATVKLSISDLPDDLRDGLVEAARRKMKKSRSSYEKLDASGLVDWTISVTVNGRRT